MKPKNYPKAIKFPSRSKMESSEGDRIEFFTTSRRPPIEPKVLADKLATWKVFLQLALLYIRSLPDFADVKCQKVLRNTNASRRHNNRIHWRNTGEAARSWCYSEVFKLLSKSCTHACCERQVYGVKKASWRP